MIDVLQQLAIQQLQALENSVRIVVIHPNYTNQHLILTTLLEKPSTAYVRLIGNNLSEQALHNQVEVALQHQTGQGKLGRTHWLILDECDRVSAEACSAFLSSIMSGAGDTRIVIISRQVPDYVVNNPSLREKSCFIPHDEGLMLWDYAQRSNPPALLEVRAFGEGHVLLNGHIVDAWDGVLPRSLFFFLVDQGMTTRNQIFETFWPHLSTRDATNVFHVTKRKISEVLGTDLTVYVSGFYRISPDIELSYDAAIFSEVLQQSAITSTHDSVVLLKQAEELYKGPFLNSLQLEWVKARRQDLLQLYTEALAALAKNHEDQGEKLQALGLYLRAALTNLQREDLAASVMRLYQQMQMNADAQRIYDRLCEELETTLNMKPAPSIQELAARMRAE